MIKILVVEDEPDILDLTAYVLRRERFVVAEASDGGQAIRRWKADRPDLVVLDLGLPAVDGFEVIKQIRADDEDTPVLVLSAKREAQSILRAFNLGTDDFLPKPFEYRELIARVRAILRRSRGKPHEATEPSVEVNGLRLDPEAYEVSWRDTYVRLTPTEFRILYMLVTNSGHVVSANRLYTYVWGSEGGDANALRSHISHIRHKLEVAGTSPGSITSVPAVGYAFRPATLIPLQAEQAPRTVPVAAEPSLISPAPLAPAQATSG